MTQSSENHLRQIVDLQCRVIEKLYEAIRHMVDEEMIEAQDCVSQANALGILAAKEAKKYDECE